MELSLSHSSSLGFSSVKPHQNSSSHQAKIPVKPRGKFCCVSSKCSLNFPTSKLRSHKRDSRLSSQEDENYPKLKPSKSSGRTGIRLIRANTQLGGDKLGESPLEKVLDFGKVVAQFIEGHIVRGSVIAFAGIAAKTWLDNAHLLTLPKWSILLRASAAIVALICRDGYIGGINQIFDREIDKINKPYLTIASGRLSVQSAWWLSISFVAISILIAGVGLNSAWFVAFLVYDYFAGSVYSIPPIRLKRSTIGAILTCATRAKRLLKRSTIGAILTCATMRGYAFILTTAAAARATLGLPFQFSLPVIFLSVFSTLIFLAQGVIKDLSDLEGDVKNNVPTLASIIGARKAAFVGHGFLIHAYAGAILTAIFMPQVFRASVMIPVHAILALCFIFRAWKLEKSNYSKEASTSFYQFIFMLFDLEFLIFPFIY